jgi:capsular polysaccharide biosynthesis protein
VNKKGILLNTLISAAKALPIAVALGVAVAMTVYVIAINLIPAGYLSQSRFLPDNQGDTELEIVSTQAFYEYVSDAYAQKGGLISPDALKSILKTSVNKDGSISIEVRTANALSSYYIIQTSLESAEQLYSAQDVSISVLSAPSVATSLSREDVMPYVLPFAVFAFAVVMGIGIFKGLTLGKIRSEKEFIRVADIPVVGAITAMEEEAES